MSKSYPAPEISSRQKTGKHGFKKLPEGIEVGSIVAFALNPPADPFVCSIWTWQVGLLIDYDQETGKCKVLYEEKVYENDVGWIAFPAWEAASKKCQEM